MTSLGHCAADGEMVPAVSAHEQLTLVIQTGDQRTVEVCKTETSRFNILDLPIFQKSTQRQPTQRQYIIYLSFFIKEVTECNFHGQLHCPFS